MAIKLKIFMGIFIIILIFTSVIGAAFYVYNHRIPVVDAHTKIECQWYALRDHEKEFDKERYKTHKELIKNYDWYNSCVNHVKYPVARR